MNKIFKQIFKADMENMVKQYNTNFFLILKRTGNVNTKINICITLYDFIKLIFKFLHKSQLQ